mmetsp:Transcript_72806/g.194326  ORF Transcript_72806/g.194326 Transcript_72806/m.194326 type:complete len:224 (+) Transcript_72806:96-767(+)
MQHNRKRTEKSACYSRSWMRLDTVRKCWYTLPGWLPRIRLQIASRASLMLLNDPKMWIFSSAMTIRVRVAFSIAYFVLPSFPAMRPMHRARWSPCRRFTSFTSNDSMNRSSSLSKAMASCRSNPNMNALQKSADLVRDMMSVQLGPTFISMHRLLVFIRTCSFMCSTRGAISSFQWVFSGVSRWWGTGIRRNSRFFFAFPSADTGGNSGFSSGSSSSGRSCNT